jgi:DHA3 family macrolide efflux protein-like MFS transporter
MEQVASKNTFRNYLLFWSGQQFSLLGSNIVQFVLVIWITFVTGRELYVSLAALLGFGPLVLLGPIAGVFVDRWNRKIIIGITDTLQALLTVGLLFLIQFYKPSFLVYIFVLITFRGVFQAFHAPATTAIIPLMVPRKHLSRMNSINYLTNSIVLMIGPAIAASLLIVFSINQIMWIDIITWGMAIIPLLLIKIPSLKNINNQKTQLSETVEPTEKKPSFFQEFSAGIRFLRSTRGLLAFILMATMLNFLISPISTLLSPYILLDNSQSLLFEGFGGLNLFVTSVASKGSLFLIESQGMLALLSALLQAGVFLSSLFLTFYKGFKKRIITSVMIFIYIQTVAALLLGVAPYRWFWLMGIGMVVTGLMMPLINVTMVTILQITTPLEMQGRVMSVVMTLASAITPIGFILSGVLAEAITSKILFISAMCLSLVLTAIFWIFTNLRHAADKVDEQVINDEKENEEIDES